MCRINTEDGQEEYVDRLTDDFFGESNINCIVDMGGTTDIFIDFLQQYGEIPSGDYYVYLTVKDEYRVVSRVMRKINSGIW